MRRGVISETVYRVESLQEDRSLTTPWVAHSPLRSSRILNPYHDVGAEKGIYYQLSKIKIQFSSFFREKEKFPTYFLNKSIYTIINFHRTLINLCTSNAKWREMKRCDSYYKILFFSFII